MMSEKSNESQVSTFLKRSVDNLKYRRIVYSEKHVPESRADIVILPCFEEIRKTAFISSILLPMLAAKNKYCIVCSWDGWEGLFSSYNEFWSCNKKLHYFSIEDFENKQNFYFKQIRDINFSFETVFDPSIVDSYYNNGITEKYKENMGEVVVRRPMIKSAEFLGDNLIKKINIKLKPSVFVEPIKNLIIDDGYQKSNLIISEVFWITLCEILLDNGFTPVVRKNENLYDLSKHLFNKVVCSVSDNWTHGLNLIHACEFVLDILSGVSKLSYLARRPFVLIDGRVRYDNSGEKYGDSLLSYGLPHHNLFVDNNIMHILANDKKDDYNFIFSKIIDALHKFPRNWSDEQRIEWKIPFSECIIEESHKLPITFLNRKNFDG